MCIRDSYNRESHPYLDKDTCQIPEAIIEITPIVDVKEIQSYNGESIPFELKNKLKIQSFHWGKNWLRIKCINLKTDIILHQRKKNQNENKGDKKWQVKYIIESS